MENNLILNGKTSANRSFLFNAIVVFENPSSYSAVFAIEFGTSSTIILKVFEIEFTLGWTLWILADQSIFGSDN
jgi:hypothetical protein